MDKGQIAVLDLLLAIVIFIIILTGFFLTWNRYTNRLDDSKLNNELSLHSFQTIQQLVTSPGMPNNWEVNISGVMILGLAKKDGVIDENKLNALKTLNYDQVRSLLNLKRFGMLLLIKKGNESIYELGNVSSGRTIQIERKVLYQNEESTIQLALWK